MSTPPFTPQITANLVVQARQVNQGKSALLIEGVKDARLYRKVVDGSKCQIVAAGSRLGAEQALAILEARKEPGVLAIVDADLDHLLGKKSASPNLILTPTRDIEGIILSANRLSAVFAEFDLEHDAFGDSPEIAVVTAMAPLGFLRFAVEQKKWSVALAKLDFTVFVDLVKFSCDIDALCTHFADLTLTPAITGAMYRQEYDSLVARGFDPLLVSRGHDVTTVIAMAIRSRVGKKRKYGAEINGNLIESYLRTAYPIDAFRNTDLCRKILEWESNNPSYIVLMAGDPANASHQKQP